MSTVIAEYARLPKRAADADGLNDVIGGIGLLAVTFMWYGNRVFTAAIQGHNFEQTPAYRQSLAFFVLTIVVMFAMILLSKRYVKTLRERFVYSRLGYVSQRPELTIRRKILLIGGSVGAMLLFATVRKSLMDAGNPQPLMPLNSGLVVALMGAIGGASFFFHYAKLGFVRHLVLGAVSLVASIALVLADVDDLPALGCLAIILGISSIVAGVITFSNLLRTAPLLEDEAE
jgi:hypothetical protein